MGVEPTLSAWKADVLAIILMVHNWQRRRDLDPRPSGHEPDELPDCSTPRYMCGPTRTGRSLSSGVPLAQFIKRRHSVGGPTGPMRLAQSTRLELALRFRRRKDQQSFGLPITPTLHKPVSCVSFVSHITGKRSSHFLIALALCERFELPELFTPNGFQDRPASPLR